jgi:hypothetical protein
MTANDFVLEPVVAGNAEAAESGTYLVLLDALTAPPHLLISHHGSVYSLSVNGRQLGSPLKKLLDYVQRKKIPTLLVEWHWPENENHLARLSAAFSRYPRVQAGSISCLHPIRDLAVQLHGAKMQEANFIFELLPLLKEAGALGQTFSFELETGGSFVPLRYTEEAVGNAIGRSVPQ